MCQLVIIKMITLSIISGVLLLKCAGSCVHYKRRFIISSVTITTVYLLSLILWFPTQTGLLSKVRNRTGVNHNYAIDHNTSFLAWLILPQIIFYIFMMKGVVLLHMFKNLTFPVKYCATLAK